LPNELVKKYRTQYGLNEYDANQLCDEKETTTFFEAVIQHNNQYKAAANWIIGPVRQYLNEKNIPLAELKLQPSHSLRIDRFGGRWQSEFLCRILKYYHCS
jgi:aspartyl-tRNA(Asn)/glutamyl-tRNA(Gln) amidotransferase subunit B